jgi:tripartite-type tricarboxylate transporter receptor subunit TctC
MYSLPFDLHKDLQPIALLSTGPLWIIGRKTLPASNLKELIAWIKATPKVTAGTIGVGSGAHLCLLDFEKQTGTNLVIVPYRGAAPAMQDLLAGQIDFMIEPSSNFRSLVAAKSVKPFATTGTKRLASLPDIPTASEAGVPGFSASLWYGLWVPKGTPKDIIAKLNNVMIKVLADPPVQQRLTELGIEVSAPDQQSPEALRAFQAAEAERWWPIMKASGIKAE